MTRRTKSRREVHSAPAASPGGAGAAVTASCDGLTHVVTASEIGGAARWLRAVCGRAFLPASLTVPPGPACPGCTAVVAAAGQQGR